MSQASEELLRVNADLKQQLNDLLGNFNKLVSNVENDSLEKAFGEQWRDAIQEIRVAAEQPVADAQSVTAQRDLLLRDLGNYTWLKERSRWGSIKNLFDSSFTYKEHSVTWHVPDHGWLSARGQSFDEAIEMARRTKVNEHDEPYVDRSVLL